MEDSFAVRRRIDRLYAAFNERDVEGVATYMSPTVQWANAWEGGYVNGRANVAAYWARQWEENNSVITPQTVSTEPDGRVAVEVVQVVKDSSGLLRAAVRVTHVYTFDDDLVSRMDIGDAGFQPVEDDAVA